LSIRIYYDGVNYRFPGWRKAAELIGKVIRSENKISGDLNYIITTDNKLKKINKEFLNHNYYTDVIAFDYCKDNVLIGEIYISKERVKSNAFNYNVSLKDEMLRVMIHGLLHLCGYNDKNDKQKKEMRNLEDKWLKMHFK
jgi:probable rRNA maturation factor